MAGIAELVDLVRLTRADIGLTQPERVQQLLEYQSADAVLRDNHAPVSLGDGVEAEVAGWLEAPFAVTSILDDAYPDLLGQVHEAPALIFTLGRLDPKDRGVSVVGSRKASVHAIQHAGTVARGLVEAGLTVVSGLAYGIDAAAHEAALDAGGRTVAVVGTAIDRIYPKAHAALQQRIIESGGMVLSQFAPGANPGAKGFPMRNAIMSGYGLATIVLAAEEKSGTRHQCRAAVGHGRRLVFAKSVLSTASWAQAYVDVGVADVASTPDEAIHMAISAVKQHESQACFF